MNLEGYVWAQKMWSSIAFGSGQRTEGILKHIGKEVDEIRENPDDLSEWADVIILALDGMWRRGYTPEEIAEALMDKQQVNFDRRYPAPGPEDEPIEHIRKEGNDNADS
jgi:hypothetical protein